MIDKHVSIQILPLKNNTFSFHDNLLFIVSKFRELVQQAEDGLTSNNKETHSEFCKLQKLNESMTKDLTISQNKVKIICLPMLF